MAKSEDKAAPKAPAPPRPRCALCGAPCHVTDLAARPGWQTQQCDCSGPLRRKASVAAERLDGR